MKWTKLIRYKYKRDSSLLTYNNRYDTAALRRLEIDIDIAH